MKCKAFVGAVAAAWLTIGTSAAPVSAAGPLQVWNVNAAALESDTPPESIGAAEAVTLVAPRNGQASGKVMVGGANSIEGLLASVTDLTGDEHAVAADRVQVRYGARWPALTSNWYRPHGLDVLLDAAPGDQPTVPVWVTVAVPEDTPAGTYHGELIVRADDVDPVRVPLELRVQDWALPDPRELATWVEMVQSPDTLAVEYDVPLWSERHWELIARSFELLRATGNRTLYLPLIGQTNFGNEQSMVRWIPQADGTYDFDFTIIERYLELAEAHMGKPEIVVLNVWDVYQSPADDQWTDEWWEGLTDKQRQNRYFIELHERGTLRRELQAEHGLGPMVSVLHEGEVASVTLPSYVDPNQREHWSRLFEQLRARLAERDLEDAMMLGMLTDSWPTQEEAAAMAEISGGLPWASHAHWSAFDRRNGSLHGEAAVGYESVVWDIEYGNPDDEQRVYGWQREQLVLAHYRMRGMNGFYPTRMRTVPELNMTGPQRGLGRVGGDFWWAIKDRRGRRGGTVTDRYPQSLWRNLDIRACILAPGPDGAVPTARYMHFIEGLQEAEARVFIERALLSQEERLGDDLAERCRALLDERHRAAWREAARDEAFLEAGGHADLAPHQKDKVGYEWFVTSGWQARTEELYSLAGEVQRRLVDGDAPAD